MASFLVLRRWVRLGLIVAAGLASRPERANALDSLPHSFSRSKQFVVYARDAALRGAVGSLGEDTKAGLLSALGLRDDWQIPIVIDLRAPEGSTPAPRQPVRWTLGQTGSGLKIELDLLIGEVSRGTRIRDELVRALLLEIAYRDHDRLPAGQAYTPPPPWLVTGLSAYLENLEDGVSASMFAALLPTTQALSITEFLSRDPAAMDTTSRAVYRAYAYNLVCLLLREMAGGRDGHRGVRAQPAEHHRRGGARRGGARAAVPRTGFARKSGQVVDPRTGPAFRERPIPGLLRPRDRAASPGSADVSPPPRTRRKNCPRRPTRWRISASSPRASTTGSCSKRSREALATLSGQANPLYRQIVSDYAELVSGLSRDRTAGVDDKLRLLDGQRRDMLKFRDDVSDYMNWYEATQAATQSGSFEDYFHTVRQLDAGQPVHRPDPISVYLDGLGTDLQ